MKILVTGGAGYLGSVLVPKLLSVGHEVTVVDDFRYGQRGLLACCGRTGFRVVKGFCSSLSLMAPLVDEADVIIPLAAVVGGNACEQNPNDASLVNALAIDNLLGWAGQGGRFRAVIYPMTNAGYDPPVPGATVTEDTPMVARTVYASTKMLGEAAVLRYPAGVSLRFASVYGVSPEMREDRAPLLNWMVRQAVKHGYLKLAGSKVVRDVIHIQDATNVVVMLCSLNYMKATTRQAFNISAESFTKLYLCRAIKGLLPGFTWDVDDSAYTDTDRRDFYVDSTKITRTVGWVPRISLRDGIQELVQAYEMLP